MTMAKYLNEVRFWQPGPRNEDSLAPGINFLELLYSDNLPKFPTNGVSKVVLKPCRTIEGVPLKLLINPDVIQYSKVFEFGRYAAADVRLQKKIAADFVHESLLEVAAIKGWPVEPIHEAYHRVIESGLIYRKPCSKKLLSTDRKLSAQVWLSLDSEKAEISIEFYHSGKPIVNHLVTAVKPGIVWVNEVAGQFEWVSATCVRLTSRDHKQHWIVDYAERKRVIAPHER